MADNLKKNDLTEGMVYFWFNIPEDLVCGKLILLLYTSYKQECVMEENCSISQ